MNKDNSETPPSKHIVTKEDLIENEAQNILTNKIGSLLHGSHKHSVFENLIHKIKGHDHHDDHHDHGKSYLDKNPMFYNVGIIYNIFLIMY